MIKKSYLFIILGLISISIGIFIVSNKKEIKNERNTEQLLFTEVSNDEKKEINTYLKARYNQEFEILEHVSRFCIIQNKDSYDIDVFCNKDDIIDDIYKVKDEDEVLFYVKKVSVKDNVTINEKNLKTQSKGFYDNYVLFSVLKKVGNEFVDLFNDLGKIKSVSITKGLGIESPVYKKENNKYISYVIYDKINNDLQSVVDKNIDPDIYLRTLERNQISNNIELSVYIDEDLTTDNVKTYIKTIHDNYYVNLKYGLSSNRILFVFKNNYIIDYKEALSFEIKKTKDDSLEELKKVYNNTIVNDYSIVEDNVIFYDKFIALDKIEFDS